MSAGEREAASRPDRQQHIHAVNARLRDLGWTGTRMNGPENGLVYVAPTGDLSGDWFGLFHPEIHTGCVHKVAFNGDPQAIADELNKVGQEWLHESQALVRRQQRGIVYELELVGFDGAGDNTDELIIWVAAAMSRDAVMELLQRTEPLKAGVAHVRQIDVSHAQADFQLPGEITALEKQVASLLGGDGSAAGHALTESIEKVGVTSAPSMG